MGGKYTELRKSEDRSWNAFWDRVILAVFILNEKKAGAYTGNLIEKFTFQEAPQTSIKSYM